MDSLVRNGRKIINNKQIKIEVRAEKGKRKNVNLGWYRGRG
jgi:hypothetical protein